MLHTAALSDSWALAAREDDNNPWELRHTAIKRGIKQGKFILLLVSRRGGGGTLQINERPDLKACEWSVKLLTPEIN